MNNPTNPWLPWVDTRQKPGRRPNNKITALIPSSGKNPGRLRNCLLSLEMAAAGADVQPIVILCPAGLKEIRQVKRHCGDLARIVCLPGPFNYCRSINEGISQRRPDDSGILFLNDDALFSARGDLARLQKTLHGQNWACVGPYIKDWHAAHSSVPRGNGPVRANEPVNGCCALWDIKWLNRIGKLDEEFGIGWGLDEADLCLRVIRRGGRYGRDDTVEISHEGHATFGKDYTDYAGTAHARNVNYFHYKHGAQVATWGRSHHWWPLPGVQVSIAARNAAPWIVRALESVERALDGFRWILLIGDDCSDDGTCGLARSFCDGLVDVDFFQVKRFDRKAMTVDQAKNRVLRMGLPYQRQYPAMCLMDADDVMGLDRVRHLLWRARDEGHAAVLGDYQQIVPQWPLENGKIIPATPNSQTGNGFGPWATLFHASLVPRTGALFREHKSQLSHGDVDLWVRWFKKGIRIVPVPGAIVHHYYWHEGTVSRPTDKGLAQRLRTNWAKRKARLLSLSASPEKEEVYSSV